jgi:uncharacterized protein (TIGR02246 family)
MNTRSMLAAALTFLALGGCSPGGGGQAPAVDIAAEQQAIRDRSAAWMEAAQARDAATVAGSFYAKDAISAYDGNIRRGREAIQAGMEQDMASTPDSAVSWTTDSVTVAASGDLAYETGTITSDPDGPGEKPALTGAFVTVWKKVGSEWYAVADAGTEAGPPEAAAAAN